MTSPASGTSWPLASKARNVSKAVSPTEVNSTSPGSISTVTARWYTVTVVTPETPDADATTFALPFATAVTMPAASTVATSGEREYHDTASPGISLPCASRTRAVNSAVLPSAANVTWRGVTSTLCATGSGTSTRTDVEQLLVVSDSSVTGSTHAPK